MRALALLLPILIGRTASPQDSADGQVVRVEILESGDGKRVSGRLQGDRARGFQFRGVGDALAAPLVAGSRIDFGARTGQADSAPPPFQVLFGQGQRLSGRLLDLTDDAIRLDRGRGHAPAIAARRGVLALVQRPGEAVVLLDPFDSIHPARWSATGDPDVANDPSAPGGNSLRLPAGGASLTTHLPEPIALGRVEVAYHDPGKKVAGRRQFVDLSFRTPSGDLSTVRAVLGWSEETLGVESPAGPTLAVQPLARVAGWHRLVVRFGPDRLDLAVDRLELAHGDGASGPLTEVRLATEVLDGAEAAPGLAARFDDLQVSRLAAPSGRLEVDPGQDEARLVSGDQVFGSIGGSDDRRVLLRVDDRSTELPWSEVSGLYFRRTPGAGAWVDGLLVRLEWDPSDSIEPRDLDAIEGALVSATDAELSIETAFAGRLSIRRDRAARLDVLGRGSRIVIDSKSHHLGNRTVDDLDPPQAEGDDLTVAFDLPRLPEGRPRLSVDVVQAVSSLGNPEQSVLPGELLTHVWLNGREVDVLNRHVSARNENPERIALALPLGLLRPGRNQVRFRQDGTKDDPSKRDNLGLLGIAIEVPPEALGASKP